MEGKFGHHGVVERTDLVMMRPAKSKTQGRGGYHNYATTREARMGDTIHKLRDTLQACEAQLVYAQDKLRRTRDIDDAALELIKGQNEKLARQLQSARRQLKRWKNQHKASPL